MSNFATTIPGARGCGSSRESGGIYLSMGLSPDGVPIWNFLVDPAIPFQGEKFQGVHLASPEMTEGWPEDSVLLLDMVGKEFYPIVPDFVEEVRRMGLSRRIAAGFDFSSLRDKTVYLGLIHWRATVTWSPADAYPAPEYVHCLKKEVSGHLGECVYHLWPLALRQHSDHLLNPVRIVRPSVTYVPYAVMERGQEMHVDEFPKEHLGPGLFMIMPISHLEVVDYVPMGTDLEESGLPHVVTGW